MNKVKRLGITLVALSLALGLMQAPAAEAKGNKEEYKGNKKEYKGKDDRFELGHVKRFGYPFFHDVREDNWAIKAIIKMAGKGVFIGDTKGNFNPNMPITRAEAVVAAVRLMGLEEKAKSLGEVELNFDDAKEIDRKYHWAENYIYVGLENGLFDSNMDRFQPEKPATREWVATLLVRALGLADEANAKMNTKLSFKDARAISASAVGYVAVAVEKGLVTGYPDGTFQPNRPISRAEMAALLDRMDWERDDIVAGIKGTVYLVSPDGNQLEIRKTNGDLTRVTITEGTYIFLNGKLIAKEQVKPGYQATIIFKENGEPLLIDLKSDVVAPQDQYSGSVANIVLPTNTAYGSLNIVVGNENKSFLLTTQTKVKAEGLELELADIAVNQRVTVQVKDNIVTEIKMEGAVKQQEGTLKAVYPPSNSQMGLIVLTTAKGDVTLPLSGHVRYIYENKEIGLHDLVIGSQLEVVTLDQYVKKVTVKKVNVTEVKGNIQSFVMPTSSQPGEIVIKAGSQSSTYIVNNETYVRSGDLPLHFSDLAANQKIAAKIENQVVKEIKVEGQVAENVGEVAAIQVPDQNQTGYITIKKNGSMLAFQFAPDFVVLQNGKNVELINVELNDLVKVKTFNSKVKVVEIKEKHSDAVTVSEGILAGITLPKKNYLGSITLLSNNQLTTVKLAPQVAVFDAEGKAITLESLQLGDKLKAEIDKNLVTKITIQR